MDNITDTKLLIGIILIKKKSHINEMSSILNIPKSTLSDKLKELYKNNIVDFENIGRNKLFFLKNNFQAKQFIRLVEVFRLINLIKKYPILQSIITEIIENINDNLILIFGSYSKLEADKNSDIDIFIQTNSRKLKEEIEMINSKISVKIGDLKKENNLNKEILKSSIVITGVDKYIKIKYG